MCALLTDEQVATYLGDDIPQPERSSKHDRPTCTWDDESLGKFKVALWHPPIRSVIMDNAKRSNDIGGYTGYIESETESGCTINIEGPDRFLALDVFSPEKESEDGHFCDSLTATAQGVINDLDW